MRACPSCGAETTVSIVDVRSGKEHCLGCIGGTYLRWYVLTREDVRWLRECGIDPEVTDIEDFINTS